MRAAFQGLLRVGFRQRQPAVVARAQLVLIQNLLHRGRRQPPSLQGRQRLQPVAATGRMGRCQLLNVRHRLRRCRLWMALGDRRQVLESSETMRLKTSFRWIEAGAIDPPTTTGRGHVGQLFCQLQNTQAMLGQPGCCGPSLAAFFLVCCLSQDSLLFVPLWHVKEIKKIPYFSHCAV